ncbi:hypothetical protein SGLAM104S_06767 [Streptomyces glaucescens]
MMSAAVVSSLRVLRIRDLQALLGVGAVGGDQRHRHAHAGFKARQAKHQQRKRQQCRGRPGRRTRLRCPASASVHDDRAPEVVNTSARPTPMITAFSARKTATSGMATMTASAEHQQENPAQD